MSQDQFNTVGKTAYDFPRVTYWYSEPHAGTPRPRLGSNGGIYVTDFNNNSFATGDVDGPASINESWGIFLSATKSEQQEVVDATWRDDTISVVRINRMTERDYVLFFTTEYVTTPYAYVVRDCNHYNHAFNRFAKRVRTQINPRLGTRITVVDARPVEVPVFPTQNRELTTEQRKVVLKWSRENGYHFALPCAGGDCAACQRTLDAYNKEQVPVEPDVTVTVADVVQTIENVVALAKSQVTVPTYDLWLVTGYGAKYSPDHVCGHEDAFFLIDRAMSLSRTLSDGMNPNYRFYITEGVDRNYKGTITEGRLTIESGKRIF